MSNSMKPTLGLLALLAISACGDSLGPKSALDGVWSGTITDAGPATMTLAEDDGNISGTGTLAGSLAIVVSGTHTGGNVALILAAPGFTPANFAGTVGADGLTMSGTLNGSGFVNNGMTVTRPKPS